VTELRNRCVANTGTPTEQARDEVHLVDALKQLLGGEELSAAQGRSEFLQPQKESIQRTASRPRAGFTTVVRDYRNKCRHSRQSRGGPVQLPSAEFFSVLPSVRGADVTCHVTPSARPFSRRVHWLNR
jgi:hypothetical protein